MNKILILVIVCLMPNISPGQQNYLIEDVKLFDGYEAKKNVNLLVKDGLIEKITDHQISHSGDLEVLDGKGKTIIPGMINCHVHAWLKYHLKNAMKAGVFAVLDMHTSIHPDSLDKFKLSDGYARFYTAGYAATVKLGHGTQYGFQVPVVGENRSPKKFINESVARGSDYIKIIYEPYRPTFTLDVVGELIKESHKNQLLAVAHISNYGHAKSIVDLGINGLVHIWNDPNLDSTFLEKLLAKNVFVVPTVSVKQGAIEYYKQNGIENKYVAPLPELLNELYKLHNAGVPILAGTDPPNFSLEYGKSIHNELRLFVDAGLTPLEALKTATSAPNKIFNTGSIGIIREGDVANFSLIDGDPLKNIREISRIQSIWAGGKKIK